MNTFGKEKSKNRIIRHRPALWLIMMLLSSALRVYSFQVYGKVPVVVSCQWLEENLGEKDMVILHVSPVISDYNNGHIPGAQFLWPGWISESNENESMVPADVLHIRRLLERLGVSNSSHVVLCGINGNLPQVCRIFVTLDYIGLKGRVSILEGGFDEWKNSGRNVSVKKTETVKGKLNLSLSDNIVNTEWMIRNLNNSSYRIVDARSRTAYNGNPGTPRQGHIPGAKSLPSTDLYDGKTFHFVTDEKMEKLFSSLDIPAGARPVFYCNMGIVACVNYVGAVKTGLNPILYDGSMEVWGGNTSLPLDEK